MKYTATDHQAQEKIPLFNPSEKNFSLNYDNPNSDNVHFTTCPGPICGPNPELAKRVADSGNATSPLRVVGPLRLASILFFMAYGGSYGVEGSIAYAPPFYVLLAFLLAPFIWAIPEAFITGELSAAIPCSGGNIVWASKAFGKFFAWQSGFWAIMSIPSAVSIYPAMFTAALENVAEVTFTFYQVVIIHVLMVIFIVCINLKGTKAVSGGNFVFGLLVLGPFVVLIGYGLARNVITRDLILYKAWSGKIYWNKLVTAAVWSCGGWTNGGQLAGEIANPKRSFNIAILIVLALTLCFSLLPLAIAMGVDPTIAAWKAFNVGAWVDVADKLGGKWFRIFMGIGALVGAIGEMNCSFCAQSRMLNYLSAADDFMFPRWFAPISRFNTPYISVLTLGVISFVVSLLPFTLIMDTVVLLGSLSLLISFACLIKLRVSKPDMPRPFKIPLNYVGLSYVSVVGVAICIFNVIVADTIAQIGGAIMFVSGISFYFIANYVKEKHLTKEKAHNAPY